MPLWCLPFEGRRFFNYEDQSGEKKHFNRLGEQIQFDKRDKRESRNQFICWTDCPHFLFSFWSTLLSYFGQTGCNLGSPPIILTQLLLTFTYFPRSHGSFMACYLMPVSPWLLHSNGFSSCHIWVHITQPKPSFETFFEIETFTIQTTAAYDLPLSCVRLQFPLLIFSDES